MVVLSKIFANILLMFTAELAYRLSVIFSTEVFRHELSVEKALKQALDFRTKTIVFVVSTLLVCAICCQTTGWAFVYSMDGAAMFVAYFAIRVLSLSHAPSMEQIEFIRQSNGLDYGSGMAISYFFGYLKIVLPSTEDSTSKSIKERLEDFEDSQGVIIPVKKLFIIVPNSMYTPGKLSCDNLLESRNLEQIILNRAGIKERRYHNTVYKIKDTAWYVVAEGASPLQTFYQAMATSELLKRRRETIVHSFVQKLRQYLWDDLSCRNLCEVVLFNAHDENGVERDYGLFLKELIEMKMNAA